MPEFGTLFPIRARTAGFFCAISIAGVAMLCASLVSSNPRLVWNYTPSIPTGLYNIEDRRWSPNDRVALEPSGRLLEALRDAGVLKEGRLLLKRVAASAGDEVCRSEQRVTINGVQAALARLDPKLPTWSGCIELGVGEVFLLGEAATSFDGRYFGATSSTDIVGPLNAIVTF